MEFGSTHERYQPLVSFIKCLKLDRSIHRDPIPPEHIVSALPLSVSKARAIGANDQAILDFIDTVSNLQIRRHDQKMAVVDVLS